MMKYHVHVAVRILEIYEVQSPDAPSAARAWREGRLVYIDDETPARKVVTVKEARP